MLGTAVAVIRFGRQNETSCLTERHHESTPQRLCECVKQSTRLNIPADLNLQQHSRATNFAPVQSPLDAAENVAFRKRRV